MCKINIRRRVLIVDADFFGDRCEDAASRRSTGVNETNKSLLKKIDADAAACSCVNQMNSTYIRSLSLANAPFFSSIIILHSF